MEYLEEELVQFITSIKAAKTVGQSPATLFFSLMKVMRPKTFLLLRNRKSDPLSWDSSMSEKLMAVEGTDTEDSFLKW